MEKKPFQIFVSLIAIPIFIPLIISPFSVLEYARGVLVEKNIRETNSNAHTTSTTSVVRGDIRVNIEDKESIKRFVEEQAIAHGVNPLLAVFIAEKESRFRKEVIIGEVDGDTHLTCPATGEPIRSRGLWQINDCAHPNVPDEVAYDVVSSTLWAMPMLLERPWMWSTYKLWKIWTTSVQHDA